MLNTKGVLTSPSIVRGEIDTQAERKRDRVTPAEKKRVKAALTAGHSELTRDDVYCMVELGGFDSAL